MIRGNHTNNYAAACITIVKDQIFSTIIITAYNLIQMFAFAKDSLEMYYQRKFVECVQEQTRPFLWQRSSLAKDPAQLNRVKLRALDMESSR